MYNLARHFVKMATFDKREFYLGLDNTDFGAVAVYKSALLATKGANTKADVLNAWLREKDPYLASGLNFCSHYMVYNFIKKENPAEESLGKLLDKVKASWESFVNYEDAEAGAP